jgi:DNA-binding IclR family transcriptional regulator
MEPRDRSKAQTLKSLGLALRVLGSFSEQGERGVTELAQEFGVSKATIYRVLVTLERHRYVVQNPATDRYRLGPRLGLIAQSAGPRLDLATEAQPYIEQLRERTKEVVHLDVLDRNEAVVIAKLDGLQPVQVMSRVGDRGPAHCISTGKAILAYADPQALGLVVAGGLTRYTERTHATASSLSRELARIREAGFAVNWGEWRTEARGIAAPVADSTLRVVAALGICAPSTRLTEELVSAAAPAVIDTATRLSVHLGASESELDARRAATLLASAKDQTRPDEAPGPETERQDENPSRQRSA